ncbi:MAG: hypothetical protein Q8R30_01865 [bacterium]|nr:hypothetical protein [bacterium]MDZ4286264.1 hypothetical protein [Candidatus Sungbacteria bacterium]
MSNKFRILGVSAGAIAVVLGAAVALVASADHAWGPYHWARTANSFTLNLGDNVSSGWDGYLAAASGDWSLSNVLDTAIVAGGTNNVKGRNTPKNCVPTNGRVEVCNAKYGTNGWLGIASVWASGEHIVQGTVKMNDTYFNTAKYNNASWKQFVVCQEVGHTFGLDHQDENFGNLNLGTCMDYTNDPDGSLLGQLGNTHPNQHDYDMIETIYAHLDATTTVSPQAPSSLPEIDHSDPSSWGKGIRHSGDGRVSLYERNLGNGNKVFTFVIWATK